MENCQAVRFLSILNRRSSTESPQSSEGGVLDWQSRVPSSILARLSSKIGARGRLRSPVKGHCYGEDSSDHYRDEARTLRGVAHESTCAQAHGDQAEFSSRLDSSDGRAPIS